MGSLNNAVGTPADRQQQACPFSSSSRAVPAAAATAHQERSSSRSPKCRWTCPARPSILRWEDSVPVNAAAGCMQPLHSTTAWHTSSCRTLTAAATNSTHARPAHTTPTDTLLALRPHADEEATDPFAWKIRRGWQASDGTSHVGSSLSNIISNRPFPGGCAPGRASTSSSSTVSWCSCCTQQRLG